MFRLKPLRVDTLGEHVLFIHAAAVRTGNLGFRPLGRGRVLGEDSTAGMLHEASLGAIHAQSEAQLAFALAYAQDHPEIVCYRF